MEEDDLLGDDLVNVKSPEMTVHTQNMQDNPILMIEASTPFGETEAAKEENEKTLTRSVTRTLLTGSQQGNQRRASPIINSKPVPQVNVLRARRGTKLVSSKKATPGAGSQQKGMVDAKYPPHLHQ